MNSILRFGDRSLAVRDLQRKLNDQGADLLVDGHFGATTEAAVRSIQLKHDLVADGIAGPKTRVRLNGGDCTPLLSNRDLVEASRRLGVPIASVYAINEVESKGQGFFSNGQPVILFERHIMRRRIALVRGVDGDAAELLEKADALAAQYPALINRKPGGYVGGTAEHQRLSNARLIHDEAALESASWGAFQIMGYHAQRLGYADVYEFVEQQRSSESAQLETFVRFIEADPALHKALKAKRWAAFAKLYNGPDYARNLYDVKLERAYERHAECGCGQLELA